MDSYLTIIIPVYNSENTIRNAIECIIKQTFTNWEILIIDGASTDKTIEIAQSYNDSRIQIHSEPDKGIYDAMNKGIKKAQGEWLYFLGSDDYLLEPTVLEKMLVNTDGYDMVYGDVESTHLPLEHYGEWNYENLLYNRCHQGIFYRKAIFNRLGNYPIKYTICADHYINLLIFLNRHMHTQYRPVVVAHHSDGGASQVTSDIAFYSEIDRLIIRHGFRSLPREILVKHCRRALKNHCAHLERFLIKTLLIFIDKKIHDYRLCHSAKL